jgi:hypothetical protein
VTKGSPVLSTAPADALPRLHPQAHQACRAGAGHGGDDGRLAAGLQRRDERDIAAGQLAGAVDDALEHHRVVERRGELAPDRVECHGFLPASVDVGRGAQPVDGHGGQVRDAATQRGLGPAERRSVAAPDQQRADRLPDVGHGDRGPGGEGLQEGIRRPAPVRLDLGGEHGRATLDGQGGRGAVARDELQRAHQAGGTAVARDQPQARLAVDPQEDRSQVAAGRGARDGGDVRHRLLDRGRLQQTAKGRQGLPLARAHVVPRSGVAHRWIGRSAPGWSRTAKSRSAGRHEGRREARCSNRACLEPTTQALCPSSRGPSCNTFSHIAVGLALMPPGKHAKCATI